MRPLLRRMMGLGMAILILMSSAATGFSPPSDGLKGEECGRRGGAGPIFCQIAGMVHPQEGPPVLISIVSSERGFALGAENRTLPVRLQVERVRGIDPSQVRRLLGENRTLGEIKAEIEGEDRAYSYRGNIRVGQAHYLLEELRVTSEGGNSTLVADLMEPVWGAIPTTPGSGRETAGQIDIRSRRQEDGSAIGIGSLVIFSGPYTGSYAVVLDSSIGTGCGMGGCPGWLGGPEVGEMRAHRGGPSSPPWRSPGFQDPFLERILGGPGL
ncbi:hypothetical protein [Methanocrinis sp.]|uniref:hypothetical protein n=1 Tax=Methanocrinis sp. TaxID=3101522 RepID=UPI003D09FA82